MLYGYTLYSFVCKIILYSLFNFLVLLQIGNIALSLLVDGMLQRDVTFPRFLNFKLKKNEK